MLDSKLLGIYLNDHLAGSTVGLELVKRSRGANEGTDYGEALGRIAKEIEEDRQSLERLMEKLQVKRDHLKVASGWAAEKVGRLKPNGQLTGYSPLSRVVELEALGLGIAGKHALWQALAEVAGEDPRIDANELARLTERAERQRDEIWQLRQRAARDAFTASS
jgi:hypothetical protein